MIKVIYTAKASIKHCGGLHLPLVALRLPKGLPVLLLLFWLATLRGQAEQDLSLQLQKARQSKNPVELTTLLIKQGDQLAAKGSYLQAEKAYLEAYDLAVKRRNVGDEVFVAAQLGNTYDQMGKLNEALQWYNKALNTSRQSGEDTNISMLHVNLGNLYLKIGSFSQSLLHYQQALAIKRQKQDNAGIANVLMNLSVYHLKTENYQKTLEYQLQALDLRQRLGDQNQIASTLNSISITYRHLRDYPKAFEFNKKALDLAIELKNPAKIASFYNNLGVLHNAVGDLPKAKAAYLKSYELKKDSKDYQSVLSSLHNLADICNSLNQLTEAKLYLDRANALLQQTQFYEITRNMYKTNADYQAKMGNYKAALDYYKRYHIISDSLSNEQKMKQLSELEIKYEVLEKEKNIELLTKNNELTKQDLRKSNQLRNYLMLIIALILLSAAMLIWRYLTILQLNRRVLASREELNLLNLELEKRVDAEVENRRQQEQKALRQSRLAILGELAAGIAHELNQPMQTLSLTLENIMLAIQDEQMDGAYLQRKMGYLFEDITRMQEVIEHIRRFSRQSDDIAPSEFAVNKSIQGAYNMVKDRFEQQGIMFSLVLADGLPDVYGNQYKFEHVILNLLTNARDAILENLQAERIIQGFIKIKSYLEENLLVISVKDNGCGIDPGVQDKVFDIFFTTKSLDKGTGLGLAISAGIIQGMHASLDLVFNPPLGTVAFIRIPLTEMQAT